MSVSEDYGQTAPPDLRTAWLALFAWAGAWCGVTGGWVSGGALAVAAVAGAMAWWRRSRALALGVACAAVAAGTGALYWWANTSSPLTGLARQQAVVTVEGVVAGDPKIWAASGVLPGRAIVSVDIRHVTGHGASFGARQTASLMLGLDGRSLLVGQRIAFTARASWPTDTLTPQVRLTALGDVTVVSQPGAFDRVINRLREGLRESMAHSPPDQAALVPGIVVGDVSALPADLKDDFKATSLSHLDVVSGTHLSLMSAFLVATARLLGARGRWLRGITVVGIVLFVALCHSGPSVLRAAAMGLVALAAAGVGASAGRGLRQWGVAVAAICLVQPVMSHSWGFALSASATAAILWWSPTWTRALARWMPYRLAQAIAVPLAAQLASQPLITALNGQVSLVGLFANMVAEPFVGPVTVLGLMACLLSPLGVVAVPFGWLAGWCVEPIILTARAGASLPGATIAWGASEWGATAVALATLTAVCWLITRALPRVLSRWWSTALALAMLAVGVVVPMPAPGWPGQWSVAFCDVGQGDAAVVRVTDGVGILVDAGPDPPSLQRCLSDLHVKRLALVVFSHEHSDHMAGASGLAKHVKIDLVLIRAGLAPGAAASVSQLIGDPAVPVAVTWAGQVVGVGAVVWTTLRTGPVTQAVLTTGEGEDPQANNASTIGRVEVDGLRVLFTGDAEPEEQSAAVASGVDLGADVFKVPHHGSAHQDAGFLAAVGAGVAVISVGLGNDYGHPAASTVSALQTDGMAVYRTDQMGAVSVGRGDGSATSGAAGVIRVHPQHRPP